MKNSATDSKILVVGATGFLGMEICRQLTVNHKQVFGFIRKTAAEDRTKALQQWGVQFLQGDLKDRASIKKALQGINIVISTASSTFSRQDGDSIQTVDNEGQSALVEEAKAAGVSQFIFVSFSFLAQGYPLQTAKQRAEKKIKSSGMGYTIIKPSFFMEAWLSPAIGFDFPNAKATIYGEGKNKISWIAISDVAAFVVAMVNKPEAKNKTFEIGGPEALSPLEVVAIFENASARKFELQLVPVEALQGQWNAAPDDLSKSFASLMLFYASGHPVDIKEPQSIAGLTLKHVRDYAAQVSRLQTT